MQESLLKAVHLFNDGDYAEFQDQLDSMTSHTRAASERRFYTVLKRLAEAMLQLGDGDVEDAVTMLGSALKGLDEFVPRFRGIDVSALRDDVERTIGELRAARDGRRTEHAPSKLPRLRVLPQ